MRTDAQKAARRLYYAAHKDEINSRRRLYIRKNKDKINARKRAYTAANIEHVRAQKRITNKKYRDSHKEILLVRHKEYRRGKGRQKEYQARLRARYHKVWLEICAAGADSIRSYLASKVTAKTKVSFAEWFSRVRRDIGWSGMKLRGQYGVYTLVHDFGI